MSADEYVQFILEIKKETSMPQPFDKTAAYEAAQLISGSFTYPLYEALWVNFFDVDAVTQHLESLYDSGNHFGLVYFTFILAIAVDLTVPAQFTEMSANDVLVPALSAALIEDWLEYDAAHEATDISM
jgi:hypothetical protein